MASLVAEEAAAKNAQADYDTCISRARWDIVRMWDPEAWCFGHKANKGSAEVRLEIARQHQC
jgi:hypothetical protein